MKSRTQNFMLKYCVFLTLTLFSKLSFSQVKGVLFYDDCEATNKPVVQGTSGNVTTGWSGKHVNTNATLARSSAYARKGSFSYKHTLTNSTNDGWEWMKSELNWNFAPAGTPSGVLGANSRTPLNLRWFAYSTLIPASNKDFNTITGIGFNTKAWPDDYTTPTFLAMEKGRYIFWVTKINSNNQSLGQFQYDCGPVVKDQWEDWVMNRNFTSKDSGFVRLYKNGKLMVEYLGGNWKDDGGHAKEPYVQQGIYKWSFGNNWFLTPDVNYVEMYTDEFRFGTVDAKLEDFLIDASTTPPANQAPVANAGANKTITLPTNSVSATGSGTDSDGTIAGYTWTQTSGPNTATITNGSSATATFSNLIQGTYTFRLTVADNAGATGTTTLTITVNPTPATNLPPSANAGTNKTITLPTNSTSLSGSATDTDGTIASYRWTQVSGPAAAAFGSATAANSTVNSLVEGVYTFRLTITDNDGATATDDVSVTVNPAPVVNQAPVANAGRNQSITLPANSVSLTGSASDADGTISSFRWTQVSGPNTASMSAANSAGTNVSNLVVGTYIFRLTVTDNDGSTSVDDVTVSVIAAPVVNQAPVANAGNNSTITLPTNSLSITGSATDADGTIASYLWSQVSGPSTATIGSSNAASSDFSSLVQGIYVFRLTVTDNDGATDVDDVSVTVNAAPVANQAPVANAGNNRAITLPTNSLSISGSATDADGTIASYRWSQVSGPSTATIGSSNAATSGFSALVQGTYILRLTVTDNDGATDVDDVSVIVNAAPIINQAPEANAGNNRSITLPTNSITITGSGTDADGTVASYRWSQVSGPTAATIGSSNAATSGFSNLSEGNYSFRLTVTDNNGATGSDDVVVTVNPAAAAPQKKAPVARAGGKKSITGTSTQIDGTASYDPDGTIVSYSWSQTAGPGTSTIANAKSVNTTVSNLKPGTYTYQLLVTDNDGMTASEVLTVAVAAAPLAPNANAGTNVTITLPTNATVLNGSASTDPDGTIQTFRWSQVSGPNTAGIASATASISNVNNLVAGTYQFRLEVTDNQALKGYDTVTVTVRPQPANKLPVIVTETALTVSLPADTVVLDGSKSYDPDGTIKLYQWKFVNGPSTPRLINNNTKTASVTGLVGGVYTFQLLVRDDRNGTVTKEVSISVTGLNNQVAVSMRVYPNPVASNGALTIRLDDATTGKASVRVYNMSGVMVMQDEINKQSAHFIKNYNLSNLFSGTYFVRVQFENQEAVTKKIVKQ